MREWLQPSGLGPTLLRPLTTNSMLPAALTELGYQPVGISADTRCGVAPSGMTATAFEPPSVAYSVPPSGDSARLFGAAPRKARASRRVPAGARASIDSRTVFDAVSMTAMLSALSCATYRSVLSLL